MNEDTQAMSAVCKKLFVVPLYSQVCRIGAEVAGRFCIPSHPNTKNSPLSNEKKPNTQQKDRLYLDPFGSPPWSFFWLLFAE